MNALEGRKHVEHRRIVRGGQAVELESTTARAGSFGKARTVEVLKVSSRSSPNSVAGALAGVIRQHGTAHMQVIGAGALNQAIKAVAIARGYVAPSGIDLVCVPTFADVEIDGESRTAIRLTVEDRDPHRPIGESDGEIDLEREQTGDEEPAASLDFTNTPT